MGAWRAGADAAGLDASQRRKELALLYLEADSLTVSSNSTMQGAVKHVAGKAQRECKRGLEPGDCAVAGIGHPDLRSYACQAVQVFQAVPAQWTAGRGAIRVEQRDGIVALGGPTCRPG